MAQHSKIEWTHHTFNPWWGCMKVSPGCVHCYAESFAKRTGNPVWGTDAPRRFFNEKHWAEPRKWNAAAQAAGQRQRVFCASMADVFEDRDDLRYVCLFVHRLASARRSAFSFWMLTSFFGLRRRGARCAGRMAIIEAVDARNCGGWGRLRSSQRKRRTQRERVRVQRLVGCA